jgi:hypothetical protein
LSWIVLTALADSSKSRALLTQAISLPAPEIVPINFLSTFGRVPKFIPFLFQRPYRPRADRRREYPRSFTHLYTHSFPHDHALRTRQTAGELSKLFF